MQAKEVELTAKIALDKSTKEDVVMKAQFDKLRSDLYVPCCTTILPVRVIHLAMELMSAIHSQK